MPDDAPDDLAPYAEMLASMGAESRLRILRLLLRAHPNGATAGEIAAALDISASTLSHHLERLKRERLVAVKREGTYLRYTAHTQALEALLRFLHAECRAGGSVITLGASPNDRTI